MLSHRSELEEKENVRENGRVAAGDPTSLSTSDTWSVLAREVGNQAERSRVEKKKREEDGTRSERRPNLYHS